LFRAAIGTKWSVLAADETFWREHVRERCGPNLLQAPPPNGNAATGARMQAMVKLVDGRSGVAPPPFVRNHGGLRLLAASVGTEVAAGNVALERSVADVQQHHLQTQRAIYTPHAAYHQSLESARNVQRMFGAGHGSFFNDFRSSEIQVHVAELRARQPLPPMSGNDARRMMGRLLGLPWLPPTTAGVRVRDYCMQVQQGLAALVLAGE